MSILTKVEQFFEDAFGKVKLPDGVRFYTDIPKRFPSTRKGTAMGEEGKDIPIFPKRPPGEVYTALCSLDIAHVVHEEGKPPKFPLVILAFSPHPGHHVQRAEDIVAKVEGAARELADHPENYLISDGSDAPDPIFMDEPASKAIVYSPHALNLTLRHGDFPEPFTIEPGPNELPEVVADHAVSQFEHMGVVKLGDDEKLNKQKLQWAEDQADRHADQTVASAKRFAVFDKDVTHTHPSTLAAMARLRASRRGKGAGKSEE